MEAEWREIVEEDKARIGVAVEKQSLSIEKEDDEFNCDDSAASFVACAKEEKARAVQEAISTLMNRHRGE